MASAAILAAMHEDDMKHVHPFFQRSKSYSRVPQKATNPTDGANDEAEDAQSVFSLDAVSDDLISKTRNPKKSKDAAGSKKAIQRTLSDTLRGNQAALPPSAIEILAQQASSNVISSSDIDDRAARRKRRRTSEIEARETGCDNNAAAEHWSKRQSKPAIQSWMNGPSSPRVVISPPLSSPALPAMATLEPTATGSAKISKPPHTPPRKLLRLNANGKFSSPVLKPQPISDLVESEPKRRGRPRKAKEKSSERHLLIVLAYGTDTTNKQELASKVASILAGELRHTMPTQETPRKSRRQKQPTKPTHPFFTGKKETASKEFAPAHHSPRKVFAVTPGKLRTKVLIDIPVENVEPQYPWLSSALLHDRLMVKHPGSCEAQWPSQEDAHVRGLTMEEMPISSSDPASDEQHSATKQKQTVNSIPRGESLLNTYASTLTPEEKSGVDLSGLPLPHISLYIPTRELLTGHDITRRVDAALKCQVDGCDEDELAIRSLLGSHPAVKKLYAALPSYLTPRDEGKGETQPWTHKYAPMCADEVLQVGKEAIVLRDWLKALIVSSVEGAAKEVPVPTMKTDVKPKKNRRRRAEDLDDFLVSDDEIFEDMNELTDPENDSTSIHDRKAQKRSVVCNASSLHSNEVKLSNAILLSGPHGSGKTAAAHAVAKELSFRVFEINPGERRSGKDVLDKVGDMTENHLVKHHGTDGELSSTEEPNNINEAFQRDLESGRQGKMSAFFKPNASVEPKQPKKKPTKAKVLDDVQKMLKKLPKDQQQSLILLEEVDLLFKDDKEFWSSVLRLIATSKRPFIMTCNDEDLVPLQAISLHAILRFSRPPAELLIDYLLLVAATEGHLLEREAVTSLCRPNATDLRASMMALDFRCQMGIGDPKCGLSWIYQRWPPGSDLDVHGHKKRVVSVGTFKPRPVSSLHDEEVEQHMLEIKWKSSSSPGSLLDRLVRKQLENPFAPQAARDNGPEKLRLLSMFSSAYDSLSDADIFIGLAGDQLDPTQPRLLDRTRAQYIEGLPLLQADPSIEYSELSTKMAINVHMLAYALLEHELARSPRSSSMITASLNPTPSLTEAAKSSMPPHLDRHDFTCFDPISVPLESTPSTHSGLQYSALDGPLTSIALDIAPYVRSIVQYDMALDEQRQRLSSLLSDSDGPKRAKRSRTTRAARSALEGTQRASTRRERWFTKDLNLPAVLATSGMDWPRTSLPDRGLASARGSQNGASTEGVHEITSSQRPESLAAYDCQVIAPSLVSTTI